MKTWLKTFRLFIKLLWFCGPIHVIRITGVKRAIRHGWVLAKEELEMLKQEEFNKNGCVRF